MTEDNNGVSKGTSVANAMIALPRELLVRLKENDIGFNSAEGKVLSD